jgi:hypothetical protein
MRAQGKTLRRDCRAAPARSLGRSRGFARDTPSGREAARRRSDAHRSAHSTHPSRRSGSDRLAGGGARLRARRDRPGRADAKDHALKRAGERIGTARGHSADTFAISTKSALAAVFR